VNLAPPDDVGYEAMFMLANGDLFWCMPLIFLVAFLFHRFLERPIRKKCGGVLVPGDFPDVEVVLNQSCVRKISFQTGTFTGV
jgi:peptidoglycan/LPS O-acetylase OafA/YrhL